MEWSGAALYPAPPGDHDVVFEVGGMAWQHYEMFLRARGEAPRPRMAYLDGMLQIVTTGRAHEMEKKLLARLIECFADETDLELTGIGNATFKKRAKAAGLEPDECYCVDGLKDVPDLAIEVVVTSGGLDKLEIYRRLGIREVWFVIDHEIAVHRLVGDRFRKARASGVLRGIELAEIGRILGSAPGASQTSAVRKYRARLRARS